MKHEKINPIPRLTPIIVRIYPIIVRIHPIIVRIPLLSVFILHLPGSAGGAFIHSESDKWVPNSWSPYKWVPGQACPGTIGSRANESQDKWVPGKLVLSK